VAGVKPTVFLTFHCEGELYHDLGVGVREAAGVNPTAFLTFHCEGELHCDLGGGVGEVAGVQPAVQAFHLSQAQARLPFGDGGRSLKKEYK